MTLRNSLSVTPSGAVDSLPQAFKVSRFVLLRCMTLYSWVVPVPLAPTLEVMAFSVPSSMGRMVLWV